MPVFDPTLASVLPAEKAKELIRLCRTGRLYDVEAWIKARTSISVPADFKASPLEVAVETGFHSLVLLLARNVGRQEIKNKALQKATELRRLELVELLVNEGARVPEIPLICALRTWDSKIIQFYLDHGADVFAEHPFAEAFCEKIRTALGPFIKYRGAHPEIAQKLQEQLDTALRHFCHEGDVKWVSLLMWTGADPRTSGPRHGDADDPECYQTALQIASSGESVEVLKGLRPNREGSSNPELFSDVSAINEVLGQLELTGSLFAGIASKDREFAQKCFPSARVALVRLGEYALARTFIKSPRSTLEMLADLLNRTLEANPSPPTARSLMLQNADVENYIEDVQHLLEILAGVGANDEAHHLRLLAIESVNRTEIRDQIKEKLSDL